MPTPISISSSASVKVGVPAAGTVQLVSATPIEPVAALTRSPRALQAARSAPASAAAPTIFSTSMVPATPRRPVVKVESSTATSSLVITVATSPSISAAISKFMMSPE